VLGEVKQRCEIVRVELTGRIDVAQGRDANESILSVSIFARSASVTWAET
jgi:hypothetical protein